MLKIQLNLGAHALELQMSKVSLALSVPLLEGIGTLDRPHSSVPFLLVHHGKKKFVNLTTRLGWLGCTEIIRWFQIRWFHEEGQDEKPKSSRRCFSISSGPTACATAATTGEDRLSDEIDFWPSLPGHIADLHSVRVLLGVNFSRWNRSALALSWFIQNYWEVYLLWNWNFLYCCCYLSPFAPLLISQILLWIKIRWCRYLRNIDCICDKVLNFCNWKQLQRCAGARKLVQVLSFKSANSTPPEVEGPNH